MIYRSQLHLQNLRKHKNTPDLGTSKIYYGDRREMGGINQMNTVSINKPLKTLKTVHLLKILSDRIDFGRISSVDFLLIFFYSRVRTDHAKFRGRIIALDFVFDVLREKNSEID